MYGEVQATSCLVEGTVVAAKLIRQVPRFLRDLAEPVLLRLCSHANVVAVRGVFRHEGAAAVCLRLSCDVCNDLIEVCYTGCIVVVMEYVPWTLKEFLLRGDRSYSTVCNRLWCDGLRLVHRFASLLSVAGERANFSAAVGYSSHAHTTDSSL